MSDMPEALKQFSLAFRFWTKVIKGETCWLWVGARAGRPRQPYGKMGAGGHRGKTLRASRVSWELHNGPIPTTLQVLHKCDNGLCVNPAHLFLGTHVDNMKDAIQKGRLNRGGEQNRRKTSCVHGHPFTPENTLHTFPNGRRVRSCKTCRATRSSQAYERLKEKQRTRALQVQLKEKT